MPQKYKFSYTYANITAKMWHFSAKMPHFVGCSFGTNQVLLAYSYTNAPCIYRICTVYVPYINRVSTVINSVRIAVTKPEKG